MGWILDNEGSWVILTKIKLWRTVSAWQKEKNQFMWPTKVTPYGKHWGLEPMWRYKLETYIIDGNIPTISCIHHWLEGTNNIMENAYTFVAKRVHALKGCLSLKFNVLWWFPYSVQLPMWIIASNHMLTWYMLAFVYYNARENGCYIEDYLNLGIHTYTLSKAPDLSTV